MTVQPDGTFSYVPNGALPAETSFSVSVSDGIGSRTETVTLRFDDGTASHGPPETTDLSFFGVTDPNAQLVGMEPIGAEDTLLIYSIGGQDYAQVLGADLGPKGDASPVGNPDTLMRRVISAVPLSDGGIVLHWFDNNNVPVPYIQVLNSDGTARTEPVATKTSVFLRESGVAVLENDTIVFFSTGTMPNSNLWYDAVIEAFTPDGKRLLDPLTPHPDTLDTQHHTANGIIALDGGGFAVAWFAAAQRTAFLVSFDENFNPIGFACFNPVGFRGSNRTRLAYSKKWRWRPVGGD